MSLGGTEVSFYLIINEIFKPQQNVVQKCPFKNRIVFLGDRNVLWILHKNRIVLFHLFNFFLGQKRLFHKTTNKHDIPYKKTVTFYEKCRSTPWIMQEFFAFCPFSFLVKKTSRKTWFTFQKKTVTFYETCRSIIRGFLSIYVWSSTFALFCPKKTTKKPRCTLQKKRYVL